MVNFIDYLNKTFKENQLIIISTLNINTHM